MVKVNLDHGELSAIRNALLVIRQADKTNPRFTRAEFGAYLAVARAMRT